MSDFEDKRTPNESDESGRARRAVGEIDGEFVLYGRWDSDVPDGPPPVNFAYVPLSPNEMERCQNSMQKGRPPLRMSVDLIKKQVRRWDLHTWDRDEPVDPKDAKTLGTKIEFNVIEGVAGVILDARRSVEAQEALANFTTP